MLSKTVVETDNFLDLSLPAQALYLHLSLTADDDGFLSSARSTARSIGAGRAELDELVNAEFLIAFESGVMLIRHWLICNALRADRRRSTVFIAEREMVTLDRNGVYCLRTEDETHFNEETAADDGAAAVNVRVTDTVQDAEKCQPSAEQGDTSAQILVDSCQPSAEQDDASAPSLVASCQPAADHNTPSAPTLVASCQPTADHNTPSAPTLVASCQPNDNHFPSQVRLGKVRLGKVRLGEVRLGQDRSGEERSGQEKEREGERNSLPWSDEDSDTAKGAVGTHRAASADCSARSTADAGKKTDGRGTLSQD
jgi:hypothetical protein